jgi:multidrug efflux pump
VQTAEILGGQYFSLRAWLDPKKLAGYGLTASDVSNALSANDYISAIGNTKGQMVQVNLVSTTNLHSLDEFKNLVVKQVNGGVIRLSDVGTVELGADSYEANVAFDGRNGVFIGIQVAPSANLLTVANGVKAIFPDIKTQLPQGLNGEIIYDSTDYVNQSIGEVATTLIEALVIVMLVIFAFLGSPRSVLIPIVAIPLSLVGTFAIMLALGFSINLLTLLALVLAIGLVVDDAIIVVESVNRHLKEGITPIQAALQSARELSAPIIAMTVVLVAVYVPIGFQGGLTGALFTEFAFTLVGAVTMSAIIALTLTPMLCSRFLKPQKLDAQGRGSWLVAFIDRQFERILHLYQRFLAGCLDFLPVTIVFALLILGSIYFLFRGARSELAPQEDQGVIISFGSAAPNATLQQRLLFSKQVYDIAITHPEVEHVFQIDMPGNSIAGMVLKPWDQRVATASQLQPKIQQQLGQVVGSRIVAIQPPSLPGASGLPIQVVIGTTKPFAELNDVTRRFVDQAVSSHLFMFLDTDLKFDQPQAQVEIDRDKTSQMGLSMSDVGGALAAMLGGGYVNYFSLDGRSYKVMPQVQQRSRLNTDQLLDYQLHLADGRMVSLSTIAHIDTVTIPETLNHFQQLNGAVVQGVTVPGVTQGDAIAHLQHLAATTLPQGYTIDYAGPSRQFVQESSGFALTFLFALIIIFLSLSALFESFRDPVIILVSVPMSIAGAMIFISVGIGGASMNIYTEVGLVTLMGLVSKHGILIVDVANARQAAGRTKRQAVEEAAAIRLRPILMTTAAMVLGVIPLIAAHGAGAVSRFNMGLVIASGIAIGTLFTIFVVPGVYMLLASNHATAEAP